jgi:hypothetical protein
MRYWRASKLPSPSTATGRGCVKTIDDFFVSAKDRDLVDRGSILRESFE